MNKNFYITTTLPYVNADPHIGFALEIVQADIIVRYRKLIGDEVFFNTGTDEHGVKVYTKAIEAAKDTQSYTDEYAEKFKKLKEVLNLYPEITFIRTTDAKHKAAAQEFWRRCKANNDIYKKNYQVKYCIGCELEKTDSELVDGKCSIHPNLDIEIRDEENYFFAFSKYGEKLLALYDANPDFVVPAYRLNEIKVLIKEKGLEDFSISRLKSKMPWGIAVPEDEEHVMYVWFDALINYVSTIGWPNDMTTFEKWWPVTQLAGKDQVRQQAAMWQAMLMSAGIPASKQIIIHGFIQSGGQKMSKSLGNVIDPYKVVEEYSVDALRYYLAREVSPFEDSDFTMAKFKEVYNANLANGVGNLTSRIMRMATSNGIVLDDATSAKIVETDVAKNLHQKQTAGFENFNIKDVADAVWEVISFVDKLIQTTEPFKTIKTDKAKGGEEIRALVAYLDLIAVALLPILPETAAKISDCIKGNKMPDSPLFVRKD